ncbi:MAG: glycerophosphodiester phosphodiesterase [bacterium]|nr:glycerophosphodiester phosphodiesterase [bacterium]
MTKPMIIAHRGKNEFFPENTLISFQEAIKVGADAIELDVQFTKDKRLVVHHDYLLGHTDNGEDFIFNKDLDYIKSLDAGSWFGTEFKDEKIPTLDEIFHNFGDKVNYEIELKGFDNEFIKTVLSLIDKYNILGRVEITSSNQPMIIAAKKLIPKVKTGIFISSKQSWMDVGIAQRIATSQVLMGNFNVAHCPLDILTQKWVDYLHSLNIKVHAANCDEVGDLETAFHLKVDQLSTNKLERALDLRKSFLDIK